MVKCTIIKGNIVTPKGVLYGGYLEVIGHTIVRVEGNTSPLPKLRVREPAADEDPIRAFRTYKGEPITSMEIVESPWVLPGFVDIHNHGVGGIDEVCDHWAYPEFSQKYLAQCGTLSTLASVIFSKTRPEATQRVISAIESRVGKVFPNCAMIEGIHAEGPIIQDQGGLPAVDTEMPLEQFKELCATMPSMKVMTISPCKEAPTGYARMKHLIDLGVRISLGHDRHASESDILGALQLARDASKVKRSKSIDATNSSNDKSQDKHADEHEETEQEQASASADKQVHRMHSTHMYNVMSQHHRKPSLVNFLLCRRLPAAGESYHNCLVPTVEIIADLIHIHPVVVQAVLSARPIEDIAIISDCISSYEPGKHLKYNGRNIVVRAEGGCYLCDQFGRPTQTLAGSTVTLADQFLTLITHFRLDVASACLLLATTPAKIANIDHVGAIEPGKKANILLLNGELNTITQRMVYGTWVAGTPHRMLKAVHSHM